MGEDDGDDFMLILFCTRCYYKRDTLDDRLREFNFLPGLTA